MNKSNRPQSQSNSGRKKSPLNATQQQQQQRPSRSRSVQRQPRPSRAIPAAYGPPQLSKREPEIRTGRKTCRIVHSEFFHDVLGTVAGHFVKHVISPSNSGVFPWLSSMSNLYESYMFNSLRFRYKNRVGTLVGGTFAMAPDYDNNDSFPSTKGELLTYDDKADCAPYESCVLTCSQHNLRKRSSFFTGTVPVGKDSNLYNVANLFFYTGGNPDSNQIGELYVEYDITFTTPQAFTLPYPDGLGGQWFGTSNSAPFGNLGTSNNLVTSGTMQSPVSTGTSASQTTFTWITKWKGFVTVNFTGTGLTSINEAGTANFIPIFTEIGFSTQIANCYMVSAHPGETFILSIGDTTITRADIVFGQAPNPLL